MSDNTLLDKLQVTAQITGGSVFFATEEGLDPEYIEISENADLLPNGMYIRLEGSDGSVAYISAFEIDKAIGIIGEMSMSKANKADVDTVVADLENKASVADLELINTELSNKASNVDLDTIKDSIKNKVDKSVVDALISQLNLKANKSEVENLSSLINAKVDNETIQELSQVVYSKADNTTVESLKNDVKALQKTLGSVDNESSIEAIRNQIEHLNSEINKRLTIDDLTSINSNITSLNTATHTIRTQIDSIDTNLNKKATTTYVQGQVNELNHAITSLAQVVDTKANKSVVDTKANKADVDKLIKTVSGINTTVNDTLAEIDEKCDEVYAALENKVNREEFTSTVEELSTTIFNKANKAEVDNALNKVNHKVNNLIDTNDATHEAIYNKIDEVECDLNNNLSSLQATVNNQNRQITNQANQISKLQQTDREVNEQLKTEWVRVMTPEEYNRLAPVGNTINGKPNPYAKQANILYMLVRYNKPYAIYIGEVLIAKAEQKGSVGFAYTFPISF